MDNLDFVRCQALNTVPQRKLQEALQAVERSSDDLTTRALKQTAINRYAESNIPLEYWTLKMERDFKGDPRLLAKYTEYVADLKAMCQGGTSLCFAGGHGLGKTLTITSILKKAAHKGFSCLYTTLSDIVVVMTSGYGEDRAVARRELVMVDFLAIDEADIRFFNQSDNSKDLYGRAFESIIRARLQNKLPILLATNSPNIKENFVSFFKDSLGSLLSNVEIFSVMPGIDFRTNK